MIIKGIIPIWLMIILCAIAILLVWKTNHSKNNLIRKGIIILLIFVMNLRIMIKDSNSQKATNNLDVLFVIDNTISMIAEDYQGTNTRFQGVEEDTKYIIEKLVGARFSVMTFNDRVNLITPYTRDLNITSEAIETINVASRLYAKGSTLNIVLEDMKKQLESSNKTDDRVSILFFISDGEITNEEKLKSFSSVQKYVQNGAVLGYGTNQGGKMKVKDYDDKYTYLEDYTSTSYPIPKAISRIDENNLKSIARDMGIDYIHMNDKSNIDEKIKEIEKLKQTKFENTSDNSYTDTYYIFAIPLLGMLVYEFINYKRKL